MKSTNPKKLTNIYGVGLRNTHFSFLETKPELFTGWFEIISENFFRTKGRPRVLLDQLRRDYPISCHGVSLSIASYEDFDINYLSDLKRFFDELEPLMISDHLCFTGLRSSNLHNLLPFAYNSENLTHLSSRIHYVQEFLGRRIGLENLSAYFEYQNSTMSEWDFISELLKITDCNLVLDLNNVYVNAHNQGHDPNLFLESIPLNRVQEIHMAGFSERENFYFDTHSNPLYPELIELYINVLKKKDDIPVLYEWDEDIPEFSILEAQIKTLENVKKEIGK